MNIVDVIKSQLSGEVLAKLSSLIGESEDKTRTAVGAAVPALLSSLAGLASTPGGADKLINALKQVDPSSQGGGLGEVLSGGQASAWLEKGGSLLSVLLGSAALPGIISALGKFAGLAPGPAKSLLSYLAPLILASIAKQFTGGALTPQRLTSFFAEQKSNIASAVPQGFSLADIPGLAGAATAPRAVSAPAAAESSGLPSWLLPLVGLGLLGALACWFLGQPAGEPALEPALEPAPVAAPPAGITKAPLPMEKREVPVAKEAPAVAKEALAALPDATKLGADLGSVFTSATQYLTGVKDVATAETALPKLKDLVTQIDGYKSLWDKLPDVGKASVAKVVTDHIGSLQELVDKVLGINGVGDKLKPILEALLAKLAAFKA
jgi:hypothetical protein